MADGSSDADCMRQAWAATYGRDGNPNRAMGHAVLALEAALCPLVIRNDARPTLGKALSRLREAPDRFDPTLAPPRHGQSAVDALAAALGTVWSTHPRHVDSEGKASGNTQAEAEAAVHVVLTVTHLARKNLLKAAD